MNPTITFNLSDDSYPKVFRYFDSTKIATSIDAFDISTQELKVESVEDFLDYIDLFVSDDIAFVAWDKMKIEIIEAISMGKSNSVSIKMKN